MSELKKVDDIFEQNGKNYKVTEQFVKNGVTFQVRQVLGSTQKKTIRLKKGGKFGGNKKMKRNFNGALREIPKKKSPQRRQQ